MHLKKKKHQFTCDPLHSLGFVLAADAKEKQYWITQLRSCAKHHKEGNSKVNNSEGEVSTMFEVV